MKLHKLSIPYRIIQSLPGVLALGFIAVFALGQTNVPMTGVVTTLVMMLAVAAVIGWQVAYYRRFRYELTNDTFDIRSGVISRRNREIPYQRIQNVDISRSLVQRALGIAEIRLETAGGGQSEAHLRYVGYNEAKRLQEEVRSRSRRADATGNGVDGTISDEPTLLTPLYEISERDLGVLAIASFDLRVASLLFVMLSFVAPSVLIDLVTAAPVDPIAIGVAVLLIVVIASAILSGTGAIVNNWGFQLGRIGDELRYERGLLQRYDGSIPLDKVQSLIVGENVLMRYLEYATLTVETAGYAPGQGGSESARAVPISKRDRTVSIAQQVEQFGGIPSFSRPAKRARLRYAWQYTLLLGALTAIAYGIHWWFAFTVTWWAVLFLAPIIPFAAHFKWKHRGYALGQHHIVMRSGFWRRRTYVVPYYRIQTVDYVQTVLQQRWQIATVVVDTAGSSGLVSGDPTAFDLGEAEAGELHDRLAEELQESLRIRGLRERVLDVDSPSQSRQGVRGGW